MWNPLNNNEACGRTQDALEEAAARGGGQGGSGNWIALLPAAASEHIAACGNCREAAEDLSAAKKLFRGVPRASEKDRPFFAAKVMAAINARERELATSLAPWMEVPRFAVRLAWIAALLLLAGTTWIYERGITAARHSPSGMDGPESIFEPTAPSNQDDALISMERNP